MYANSVERWHLFAHSNHRTQAYRLHRASAPLSATIGTYGSVQGPYSFAMIYTLTLRISWSVGVSEMDYGYRYVTANSFSFCFVNTYQMPIPAQREQQPYPFTPTLLRAPSTNTVLYGRLVALSDLVKRYVSPLYCILTTSNLHYVHSANPPSAQRYAITWYVFISSNQAEGGNIGIDTHLTPTLVWVRIPCSCRLCYLSASIGRAFIVLTHAILTGELFPLFNTPVADL